MNEGKRYMDLCGDPDPGTGDTSSSDNPSFSLLDPGTVAALKKGDISVFRSVCLAYFTPLTKFLSVLVRSPAEADKIARDVMVRIWEKREHLDSRKNIGDLIYDSARHLAFSHIHDRHLQHRPCCPATGQGKFPLSPREKVILWETGLFQDYLMSRMSDRCRSIYKLSRNEGLSYKEISKKLNISHKTVENHINQALNDFREVLLLFFIFITAR